MAWRMWRGLWLVGWALACAHGCAIIDAVQKVPSFTLGGTLIGLHDGASLVLQNAGKTLTLSQNGAFAFAQTLANQASYAVSVAQQPSGQTCEIAGGSGVVNRNNVSISVTCYDGSAPGTTDGTGDPGDSNNSALLVAVTSDSPTVADGSHSIAVTVTLKNRAAAPVSGREVAVSSDGAALTIAPSSGLSDANGLFVARISTQAAQNANVAVSVAGVTQQLGIAFTAGPPVASHITFTASPNAVQANGSAASLLSVRVGDAYNNPVPNQTVAFANSDSAHPPSPASVATGADGVATAALTSATVGLQTVSATVAGVSLQGTVRFTGPPSVANCTFAASPNTLLADGATGSKIQLVVRDAAGNAIGGQPVRISATGRGNAFTVLNANTLSDGSFASTFTSTHAEVKALQLNLPGNANFTAQIAFTAGALSLSKSRLGATPRAVPADGSATTAITLVLTDAQGNGIANTAVTLSADGSNNTLTQPSPQQTDAYGAVHATLASSTAQIKSVRATGNGIDLSTTVTFVPPPTACSGTLMLPQGPRQSTNGSNARSLVAADFNNDGRPDVAAVNYGSNTVAVFINNGNDVFTPRAPFAVGGHPVNLVAADLQGDGSAELLVSSDDAGTVEVFDAAGTSRVQLATGRAASLAVADVNGDSALDLLVSSNGNLLTYPGSGGSFSASSVVVTQAQDTTFTSLAAGDINNDTHPDIVAAFQDRLTIFLGGNGGVLTLAAAGVAGMLNDSWTSLADLNGDGRLDVLGVSAYALGNGDGTFGAARRYPGNFYLGLQFDVADYNGDQRLDVAGVSSGDGLLIAPGNGDGTFLPLLNLTVGPGAAATVARDFNADGNTDFAVLDGVLNSFTVALGAGRGFFQSPSPTPVDSAAAGMALGDWNNDGVTDLVLTNSAGAELYAGKTSGNFAPAVPWSSPVPGSASVILADFDGNGRPDLATLQPTNNTVLLLLNDDPAAFASTTPWVYATGNNPRALAAGDLNGDGRADLVVANANDNSVSVYLAGPGGYLQAPVTYPAHAFPNGVALARLNGDGSLDVAVSNQNSNDVSVLLGNGDGTLGTATHFAGGPAPAGLVSADFDRDGKADLAAFNRASSNNGNVVVLRGNGDGTLQAVGANLAAGPALRGLVAVDLNRDGYGDLAWVNGGNSTMRVAYGSSTAAFSTPGVYDSWELGPALLGSTDINGDSKPDAVVVHTTHPGFTVLLSAGCN